MSAAPKIDRPRAISIAADLQRKGYRVHPLRRDEKIPAWENWQHRATTNAATIFDAFDCHDGNIGIATGFDVVVLDADGAAGVAELAALNLPPAPTITTPRKGKHPYFRAPPGVFIPNSVRKIAPNIDVRGIGGQVVAPGCWAWSRKPSLADVFGPYTGELPAIAELPELPSDIVELCLRAVIGQEAVENDWVPGTCGDWRKKIDAKLWEKIRSEGSRDRSSHCQHVTFCLIEQRLTDDDIFDCATDDDALFALKFRDRGEAELRKDIIRNRRCWQWKHVETFATMKGPAPGHEPPKGPLTTRADQIERETMRWSWYPYIPAGGLTILGGRGGVGKGLVASDLCAAVTRGNHWPLSEECAPHGRTLWGESEDPPGSVLRPRWEAAGADLTRIDYMTSQAFPLMNLKQHVRDTGTKLIVLSPLVTFLQSLGLEEMNSELKVRKTLELIQAAVEGTDCAVVGICHLNKKADLDAIERLLGSVAFANYVRAVLMVGKEEAETGLHRMVHSKFNWAVKGRDFLYTPRCVGMPRSQDVRIDWTSPDTDIDPATLYDRNRKKKPKASEWLFDYLDANGATLREKVIAAGIDAGYTAEALDKAHGRDKSRFHSKMEGYPAKAFWWLGPA